MSHAMLASLTKVQELRLSDTEGADLAKALDTVNQFYNFEVAEKTMAWLSLGMVASAIYGPRLLILRMKRAARVSPGTQEDVGPVMDNTPEPDGWRPNFN